MEDLKYIKLTWHDACKEYGLDKVVNNGLSKDFIKEKYVVVFNSDLHLDVLKYENSTHFAGFDCNDVVGIIVLGDLVVSKYIDMTTSDAGLEGCLWVKGNLSAANIFISGMCELIVDNNIDVKNTILGIDTSGGMLDCKGNLTTGYALFQHYFVKVKGSLKGIIYIEDADNILVSEEEESKLVEILNEDGETLCIYNEKLEDAIDEEDWDLVDELVLKFGIFEPFVFSGNCPESSSFESELIYWIKDGKQIFKDIDIKLLQN